MDECSDKRSCRGPDRHTHSRWMTLIWEITECTLTPGPRLRRATITPDRRIGQPPTNHTAHTVRTGGGRGGDMHVHTYTHTHAHTTTWQNRLWRLRYLPVSWHWNSPGVWCLKDVRERGGRKRGRVPGEIRGGNQFHFNWSCRAGACVVVHTHCTHACGRTRLSEPHALCSHFFFFFLQPDRFFFFNFAFHRISEHKQTGVKMEVNVWDCFSDT